MKESLSFLESIGLTKQEARCYLTLYRFDESKVGDLSRSSGIDRSNIYPVLEKLIDKGLVSYRVQNNTKVFIANPSESLKDLIEDKQKELEQKKRKTDEIIEQLKRSKVEESKISNYKYYEGINGIKSMWYELEDSLSILKENRILRVHSAKKEVAELLIGFYDEFHKTRIRQKIPYRLILDTKLRVHGSKRKKQPKTEVKYLEMDNDATWGTIGDFYFIYYLFGKTPICFLIKDRKVSMTQDQVFDNLWKICKD